VVDNIMLVNHERNSREPYARSWSAGLKVYDISVPVHPQEIGFFATTGKGVHRMTYWEPPYAYLSASDEGFTDDFLIILDISTPSQPREIGRWWFPGMHIAGGEKPTWASNRRYALHHALVRGDRAYCGWWDAGIVILDISDRTQPKLVSHLDFGQTVSGCTHTAMPVPDRDLLVVTDEAITEYCQEVQKLVRVVDISDEQKPRVVSQFPVPEGDFCKRGGWFGPHNLHEMRPGSLVDPNTVYVTYFNAGVRVVDITDAQRPIEVAYYIPEPPPGRPVVQCNDIFVSRDGLIYVTDRYTGGLYIVTRTS
jgi:hypothetical protein